ncbi:helix-turn-helix domain-containing protein [Comamonas testosteroni]|uniref:helix-turn-helix domain-containing protein n=1 Tax=Comamonas testosteroni TaxID=285 RepID=UPI00391D62B2
MTKIVALSDRIRQERIRLQMSQAEMAERGGVSRASQVTYEAGRSVPSLDYLIKVSQAGVDHEYVLTGKTHREAAVDYFDWDFAKEIVSMLELIALEQNKAIGMSRNEILDLVAGIYRIVVRHEDEVRKDLSIIKKILRIIESKQQNTQS